VSAHLVDPVALPFGRYLLDIPVAGDLDDVVAALADPDVALWNPAASRNPGVTTRERARLWISDRAAWGEDHASWVVRDHDGHVVGAVSVHHLDHAMSTGEIGYWLTPAGRGRGLGLASVVLATRFGFDVLGLARIELFHAVENEASCRLAVAAGYAHEGVARQSFVYGDGLRHDEHLHGRLATDPEPQTTLPS
jgi:RimJ/RimL family protein N-acetyltransferase